MPGNVQQDIWYSLLHPQENTVMQMMGSSLLPRRQSQVPVLRIRAVLRPDADSLGTVSGQILAHGDGFPYEG